MVMAGSLAVTSSTSALTLEPIGTYSSPVFATSDPTDPDRLFVVEQEGRIRLTTGGQTTTFLDLRSEVLSFADVGGGLEHGMFSMAFAPDYATSGRFYVLYTGSDTDAYVGELTSSGNSADPATLNTTIKLEHTGTNAHYGGQLQFGPDGRLYISTGDGATPGDPFENAQDTDSLLGKILRISPTPGGGYAIPPANPLAGATAGRDEIWSYGLRNPWRFSFDRQTGDLAIGDVGQGKWEEVDFDPVGMGAGRGDNFGWDCYEARHDFELAGCPPIASTTRPVLEYPNPPGDTSDATSASVTGGYVVRDPGLDELYGRYVYGDVYDGVIRSFVPAVPDAIGDRSENLPVPFLVSFGEDSCGRVYAVSLEGPVYRLADATPTDCAAPLSTPPAEQLRASRSLTLDASKNKVKRGKPVTLSGRISASGRQGPCEAGQAVELQRKRPKKATFTSFAQVQADAQGAFSLKWRLKRPFEFRAQVAEADACSGAQSNTEKVKVKKKRRGAHRS